MSHQCISNILQSVADLIHHTFVYHSMTFTNLKTENKINKAGGRCFEDYFVVPCSSSYEATVCQHCSVYSSQTFLHNCA